MAEQYRTRGKGMTARPDYVRSDSPLETMRHLARIQKFEGSVAVAQEWAREILQKAANDEKWTRKLQQKEANDEKWAREILQQVEHGGSLSVKQLLRIEHFVDEDSDEDFAARILRLIIETRQFISEGDAEQAALLGVWLGQEIALHDLKQAREPMWDSGRKSHIAGAETANRKRQNFERRNKRLAKEFRRLRKQTSERVSDSQLKERIGREQKPPLSRSAAIAAINRGLKISS
jgi:hypothetical protein